MASIESMIENGGKVADNNYLYDILVRKSFGVMHLSITSPIPVDLTDKMMNIINEQCIIRSNPLLKPHKPQYIHGVHGGACN